MRIDFISDVACPWCAVGLNSLERALERIGDEIPVKLEFQPFELNPTMDEEGADAAEYLRNKYGMSAEQLQRNRENIRARGAEVGFAFGERMRVWNTFDAHRLLHLAAEHGVQDAVKERLLRATFTEGEPIGDHDALVRLVAEAGLDADEARAVLASDRYAAEVRGDQQQARAHGITGVPFFVVDGRYGVSGAQPAEALGQVLAQAWAERSPLQMVAAGGPAPGCDGDTCAV